MILNSVCFSPTRSTKKILDSIRKGLSVSHLNEFDITLPDNEVGELLITQGLTMIGMPVYGGRLPKVAVERMKKIKSDKQLCIVVVTYGNREYEDALLELKNLAKSCGFIPIAAGAFIAQHSFSSQLYPIAEGRPDAADEEACKSFGKKIMDKLQAEEKIIDEVLNLPGSYPYKEEMKRSIFSPITDEDKCVLCCTCLENCPTGAIDKDEKIKTEVKNCILCHSCIQKCPQNGRFFEEEKIVSIREWLKSQTGERKEPEFFLN